MTSPDPVVWQRAFNSCHTLAEWNEFIVPAMSTEGDEFKRAAATEARRRGYRANKVTQQYEEM